MKFVKPSTQLAELAIRIKRTVPRAVPLTFAIIAIFAALMVVSAVDDDGLLSLGLVTWAG